MRRYFLSQRDKELIQNAVRVSRQASPVRFNRRTRKPRDYRGGGTATGLRRAQTIDELEVGMGNVIECKLWKPDGSGFVQVEDPESPPENPDYIDKVIDVHCDIAGGENLDEAWPVLMPETDLTIYQHTIPDGEGSQTVWRAVTLFQFVPACN